jgi:hypothetical protein
MLSRNLEIFLYRTVFVGVLILFAVGGTWRIASASGVLSSNKNFQTDKVFLYLPDNEIKSRLGVHQESVLHYMANVKKEIDALLSGFEAENAVSGAIIVTIKPKKIKVWYDVEQGNLTESQKLSRGFCL